MIICLENNGQISLAVTSAVTSGCTVLIITDSDQTQQRTSRCAKGRNPPLVRCHTITIIYLSSSNV